MTTQEGNNAVVARHLEALANAAKEYTLAELANISVSGESYTLPTASETLKGGVKIGAGLQMDGDTLNVTIQSGSSGGTVLDTVPATVDGGLWYEVTDNVPALWLRKGNYGYRYSHDKFRFVGNASDALVAYLPFTSTLDDACGNEWSVTGSPTIQNGVAVFNDSDNLANSNLLLGGRDFSVDVWFSSNAQNTWTGPFGAEGLSATNSVECLVFTINGTTWYCTTKYGTNYALINDFTLGRRYHGAIVYSDSAHAIYVFVDGVLKSTINTDISRSTVKINIGGGLNGTIDHLRIHDGVALWTSNFTPPTAAEDYL